MDEFPFLSAQARKAWKMLTSDGPSMESSATFRDNVLNIAASVPYYLPQFELSWRNWISTPIACARLSLGRRNLGDSRVERARHIAKVHELDEILQRIQFGFRRLPNGLVFQLRKAALEHGVKAMDLRLAVVGAGLEVSKKTTRLINPPNWLLVAATYSRNGSFALAVTSVGALIYALSIGACNSCTVEGTLNFALLLTWIGAISNTLGPEWREAQRIREKLQFNKLLCTEYHNTDAL